jgi:hypothetical protein
MVLLRDVYSNAQENVQKAMLQISKREGIL